MDVKKITHKQIGVSIVVTGVTLLVYSLWQLSFMYTGIQNGLLKFAAYFDHAETVFPLIVAALLPFYSILLIMEGIRQFRGGKIKAVIRTIVLFSVIVGTPLFLLVLAYTRSPILLIGSNAYLSLIIGNIFLIVLSLFPLVVATLIHKKR